MKNFILLLALFFTVNATEARPENKPNKELTEAQQIRKAEMEARLAEIKAMDFKSMSKSEIKEIKEEMKMMKEEARATGGGIYLSVGAIIIIILLLILLL
ncbi:hypothetical protein J0A68_02040 [Algoriphagus sp. H41]|uniref:Seryl-tRNA synthetase n=1 Tax=Algoriphagus oliviformis TaxID=2811231 RepID=A0ABS3BXY2_9BACT|nr:hypothetical protein [Algoriphagus oliviformis]MBN7809719.1 hypothetical protein [Algoriphagus oliviformis]